MAKLAKQEQAQRANNKTLLTTVATIVGIGVGSFGMFLSIDKRSKDEQAAFIERITKQVKREMIIDTRITRLEERQEALKATVWARETAAQKPITPVIIPSVPAITAESE